MPDKSENPLHQSGVRAYEPENKLRGMLGEDVDLRRDVFTADKIAKSQQVIDTAVANYFADTASEVKQMADCCAAIERGDANAMQLVRSIADIAMRMKGQSETLGFTLVAKVSSSLYQYGLERAVISEHTPTIIRKHVDSLRVAFAQELKGDGGALGAELITSLEKLKTKFSGK